MTTRRGWTLVETIVLIIVILVVVAWGRHQLGLVMDTAWVTKCQTNLKAVGTGVVTYKSSNREHAPVMRDRPSFNAGVNLSPTASNECDVAYGEERPDGTIEDWSVLGDNAMQNVWLMVSSRTLKYKAFCCPAERESRDRGSAVGLIGRDATSRFGWTSPNQYSYSMHWPYAMSASGDANPAPFNATLEKVIIFADRNPGGPVSKERPPSNHAKLGTNVLWSDGAVQDHADRKRPQFAVGINGDDIYTNALGIPGGIPQHEYDTSLNISPR
jgi:hypothetical protein